MYDAMNTAASATPDQWLAAAMMSPIVPTGENANESILINCADLGWTPLRDGAAPTGVVQAGERVCKDTQTPTGNKGGSTVIPRYFLQKLERQLRHLVDDVAHEEWNERAWMCLYTYLSDLPLIVRTSLTLRDRCGAATVARLVDRMKTNFLTKGNLVEESVAMPDKTVEEDFIPSLSREVLHLLQHSTAIDPTFHFEWRASTVAYVEGSLGSASRKAGKATVIDSREVSDCVSVRPSSSSLSSMSPVLTDEEQEEELPNDDEEVVCTPRLLTFIAAHIEKYNDRRLRVVATQFPDPEMEKSRTPPGAAEAILAGAYTLSTPPSNRQSDAALQQPLLHQQGQLMSLLTSFVRLRQTPLFHTLRHTPQHALFACDFIELTSEAERLLERASSSLDTTLLLEIPMTQKRIMAETTDVRDTSVGTNTSVGSGSSPMTGHSAHHSVKARTPMKPSVRYPIQRILSNAPSPSGLSSQRSSEVPGLQKEIYPSSVYVGEGSRDGLRASQVCEVVDL
ncbi:hypothetical protein LPMP_321790 [Leishmania panamensis]|uniref:Uncharacterized protein n=1 Tax=Leishmania panamensis TaxID=5679 RepID=A0A088RYJ2_LEIPA|nr:hypothetical protein LPMP_321790 [Leishmania panamensis]AIO01064.1 hypothetical protein LPMP_321790 [Leishmania panamensis]